MRQMLLGFVILFVLTFGVLGLTAGASAQGSCGGAVPCACGNFVSASRTLVPGVDPVTTTVCPNTGLVIFSKGDDEHSPPVTLDLGGATIRGSGTGPHIEKLGIEIVVSNQSIVRNGRIVGFDVGILGNAASFTEVSNVQVEDSVTYGILFLGFPPDTNRIEKCIVRRTRGTIGASGNLLGGDGIVVGGRENTVHLCRSESNGGLGLVVRGTGNTVTRNVVLRSGGAGVEIGGTGATVELNQSRYSETGEGFKFEGVDHVFSRNIALDNLLDGFTVSATASHFDRNRGDYNGGVGILDITTGGGTGGTANTYTNNRCTGNDVGPSSPVGLCQ